MFKKPNYNIVSQLVYIIIWLYVNFTVIYFTSGRYKVSHSHIHIICKIVLLKGTLVIFKGT